MSMQIKSEKPFEDDSIKLLISSQKKLTKDDKLTCIIFFLSFSDHCEVGLLTPTHFFAHFSTARQISSSQTANFNIMVKTNCYYN